MSDRLAAGVPFPATQISVADGSAMNLPGDMADGYKVILFFRGSW